MDTLAEHLARYDDLKEYKAVYQKYTRLDPKKREAFYRKHGDAIERYKAAKAYLDAVMKSWAKRPPRLKQ